MGTTSIGVELELPRGEHRERLLAALGNLIKRRGYETFVSAPILLPQPRYFPVRWEPTLRGARRLLRRLMHYAGLDDLDVNLVGYNQRLRVGAEVLAPVDQDHTAAWFAGIEAGVCSFGLELDELRRGESLVATLAHEVAHAYRSHHGLCISDRDLEEKLTDITAVYLGFGVFSLGASLSMETGGYDAGGQRLAFSRKSLGYLSPAEFALLLSTQLVVRGRAEELTAVKSELAANHRALVAQGEREFSPDVARLRAALNVSEPLRFPPVREVEAAPRFDDDAADDEHDVEHDVEPARPSGIAFRVRATRATLLTLGAFVGAAVVGVVVGLEGWVFLGFGALCVASGVVGGSRLRADECSGCRAHLPIAQSACPGCGARIVGEIRSRDERLAAMEQYEHSANEPVEGEDEGGAAEPDLGAAMIVAWGLSRDLTADGATSSLRELAVRAKADDFDTAGLAAAWSLEEVLFTPEAMEFIDEYWLRRDGFEVDVGNLATANRLDDRSANYRRFAAILDGRFATWKARASSTGGG